MKPLRIILVLSEPPLPFGGAAARWYHVLIRSLAARGHHVTALASTPDDAATREMEAAYPRDRFDVRLFPHADSSGWRSKVEAFARPYSYVYGPQLRRALDDELRAGYDVLHLEQLWTGWLAPRHVGRALVNVHYLFSIDNALDAAPSPMERLRRLNAVSAERRLLRSFRNIVTLTPRLADAVRRINPSATVRTVPIALDLALYPFDPSPDRAEAAGPVLGLIGSFNWTPTFHAGRRLVERLWPSIRGRFPDARLLLVGRDAVRAFADLVAIPGVEIHRDVADTLPYFRRLDVLLYAPPVGSGMKVKVLEAMALGAPVVTNAEGAEGLPVTAGVHLAVEATDEALIRAAVALLQDGDLRRRRRLAARCLMEGALAPDRAVSRLVEVYREIAGGSSDLLKRTTGPVADSPCEPWPADRNSTALATDAVGVAPSHGRNSP